MIELTPLKEKHMYIKMEYLSKTVKELRQNARDRGMVGYWKLRKAGFIDVFSKNVPATVNEATKDVIDSVKKFSVAYLPTLETRVLVPKPSGTIWFMADIR